MSNLTDAEDAYRQQRAAVQLAGRRKLRRTYRRTHDRAMRGSDLAKVRLKALKDEYRARHMERPRA
jgi:hypothetical protein